MAKNYLSFLEKRAFFVPYDVQGNGGVVVNVSSS